MTEREKKFAKLLAVLVPVLLLALLYGYSQMQAVKARRLERQKKAQQDIDAAKNADAHIPTTAAVPGARVLPSPPPGATPADTHALVPAAATPAPALAVAVDSSAQHARLQLPWGRDPFVPPDTRGPEITPPANMEAPRDKREIELRVPIADSAAGDSGVKSATLFYGLEPPFDQFTLHGSPPGSGNGDGYWTFSVPAPTSKAVTCAIVAFDASLRANAIRSRPFTIAPPPPEKPKTAPATPELKLTLRAISWSQSGGVALIDGDIVAVGDTLHGYKVVEVSRTTVRLRRDNDEIVLQMKE